MVFVNSKKFACESCIKGHRSSSCSHTDRPLFEVKKKGRPVSQCEKCRELRHSKKVHSKCNCNPTEQKPSKPPMAPGQKRTLWFIPIAPALPNGIKDVVRLAPTSSNPRQRVDVLLNPCSCKMPTWNCKCIKPSNSQASSSSTGLATLARAAELCCSADPPKSFRKVTRSPSPTQSHKYPKYTHNKDNAPGPELPPLFLFDDTSSSPPSHSIPDFGFMPPINEIASVAGSGCTCGIECTCPGCVQHRGEEHADTDHLNNAHGACAHCVDNQQGIGLPSPSLSSLSPSIIDSSSSSNVSSRMIDQFFARAASLPAPPANRKMGVGIQLDPGNVMVYPSAAMGTKERGVPFGLISIPKLECCGGTCGCPAGSCSCGKSCNGCCAEHLHGAKMKTNTESPSPAEDSLTAVRVISPPAPV
ncbi:hypothetical protein GYMLUDRAFT_268063 [Collybiopsis luxurians FD-317 M1]|nr:hypothetical protein GYMLUDRAFT_268063 [Collybiopsis luxurians FD-317 M1]